MPLIPFELAEAIVELSDTADLPALALTARIFRYPAEKRLYRSIILTDQIQRAERALHSIVTKDERHKYVHTFVINLTRWHDFQSHLRLFQLIERALKCATDLTFVWLIRMPPAPLIPSPAPPNLHTIRAHGPLLKNVVPSRPVVFAVFEYSMSYNDDRGENEYVEVMKKLDESTGPLLVLSILFESKAGMQFYPSRPFSTFLRRIEFTLPCVALDLFMAYYWTTSQVGPTCLKLMKGLDLWFFLLPSFASSSV
jgi:hypothetical protein